MKHSFFILITIFSLMVTSCGSLYQSTPKKEVYHTAQYEGCKKQDGLVNMYIIYNPFTENPKINMPDSKANAEKICRNWRYSGSELQTEELHADCLSFDLNTGNCIRYKLFINAYCY